MQLLVTVTTIAAGVKHLSGRIPNSILPESSISDRSNFPGHRQSTRGTNERLSQPRVCSNGKKIRQQLRKETRAKRHKLIRCEAIPGPGTLMTIAIRTE